MIEIASDTAPGEGAENQDAYEICPHPADAAYRLCALADGQGGRAGGAAAAHTACRSLIRAAAGVTPADLMRPGRWERLMALADQAVHADRAAGFTTLVAFCVTPTRVCGASSGDSALLLANGDRPADILTARQLKNPPVGSGAARFATFAAALSRPWTLLAMSDGVWKATGWGPVGRIASGHGPVQGIIESLRRQARSLTGGRFQDDFTLIALQNVMTENTHAGG